MKKLKLTSAVRYIFSYLSATQVSLVLAFLLIFSNQLSSQCQSAIGTIEGKVFIDADMDGINNGLEFQANVMVRAYDADGVVVDQSISNANGEYTLSGLVDSDVYRIEFVYASDLVNSVISSDNGGAVQFVQSPNCNINLGLFDPSVGCSEDPQLVLTCFVQGVPGINDELETIVQIQHDFSVSSPVSKIATKAETGSVWGIAWDKTRNRIYSSAFVKQNAMLTPYGAGAIFVSDMNGTPATSKWLTMSDLGVDVGTPIFNFNDCNYGVHVGRIGLGAIAIDDNDQYLYAVDLNNKNLVKIDIDNPGPSTTEVFPIPNPGCSGGESAPFALNFHEGKLYVGTTCTAEYSLMSNQSSANVFEFDLDARNFTLIFQTSYIKGHWHDNPTNSINTMHWLTDLGFTDEGNMLISLSDRVGHRYCNLGNSRLDFQNPDLLVAWKKDGAWTLESNGTAGNLTGTGVGNNQGPDGGEFFGLEYWLPGPGYHPETALGSIFVLPGSGEVVAAVYDPIMDSYSGGLHRYVTADGSKSDSKQLYSHIIDPQFGKATGFGEITQICPKSVSEVGNFVWFDENNNGTQDAGESPISGVVINLINDECQIVGTTTTDINGQYLFNDTNVDNNLDGSFDGVYTDVDYFIQIDPTQFDTNVESYTFNTTEYIICDTSNGITQGEGVNSDISMGFSACSLLDETAFIPFNISENSSVNHSLDIGLCQQKEYIFDLALRKLLTTPKYVTVGDTAIFLLEVYNQGTADASDVTLVDYLVDGYQFIEDINPGWRFRDGLLNYKFSDILVAGGKFTVPIKLRVVSTPNLRYTNYAEISGAIDETTGLPGEDIDSFADDDPDNDNGGIPNAPLSDDVLDGDGTLDEDDHDPEKVLILDLALRKELKYPDRRYQGGEDVEYVITVFNQGSEIATEVQIVDYIPKELSYNPTKNSLAWFQMNDEIMAYDLAENLLPGDEKQFEIVLTIDPNIQSGDIMNYAEISNCTALDNPLNRDFDSKPDLDFTNDIGGQANTVNDNRIDDYGVEDEDDHDPALLRLDFFDLALVKTSSAQTVTPGSVVNYTITVLNQGSITANNIKIYDYIPEEMSLFSSDWSYVNNDPTTGMAEYTINIPGGLTSGSTHDVTIQLLLDANASKVEYVNIAEISGARDLAGNERSGDDVDSTPDDIMNNDNGGIPGTDTDNDVTDDGTNDEDDHDPARVIIIDANYNIQNQCLDNATTHLDGQLMDEIVINSMSGETWYIVSYLGFYDVASPTPPLAPVAYTIGAGGVMMVESDLGNGLSAYTLQGIHIDNQGYSLILTNGLGSFESINSAGAPYVDPTIDGPLAICANTIGATYNTTPVAGATYSWALSGGGAFVGSTSDSEVVIDWGATDGTYQLSLTIDAPNACYAPVTTEVSVGSVASALACLGNVNLSIGQDCAVKVTPHMLLTTPVLPSSSYAVVLVDTDGTMIPNATLTNDHLNRPIMAKVMEGCTGNSCWSTIILEDKVAPEIICQDITLSCDGVLDYNGPIAFDNCDSDVSLTIVSEVINTTDCDPDYVRIITRGYMAEDASGNVSDVCEIDIYVERLDFTAIIPPINYMISDNTNLSCGDYPLDAKGYPSTVLTGAPTLNGSPLYPDQGVACSVAVVYNDEEFEMSNCVRKIIRTWSIYEWTCNSNLPITYTQTIEVRDDTAPVITCPANITVSSSGQTCEQLVVLPPVEAHDECSPVSELTYDITYPNGFINNQNGGAVLLPVGTHTITYTAYDKCYNSSSCQMTVVVQDVTAPVAICKHNTIVSINQSGSADVFAHTFDNGSFDDCSLDRFEVRRVDQGSACGDQDDLFDNKVRFCCDDVGTIVEVVFRVYDTAQHYNECTVNVEVQDKFAPVITGPANVSIDCNTPYDINDLSIYGVATATDGCGFTITESVVESIDQCNVGTITRTFVASDNNGSASYTQVITVANSTPFNAATDVVWPEDYDTDSSCAGSALLPENLPLENAYPQVTEDACDLVAVSYDDKTFQFVSDTDACFKIIRTWTLIDWCQSTPGNTFMIKYDQVIKVSNTVAPVINSNCDKVEVCSYDVLCEGAFVQLNISATDDCTPDNLLNWTYIVDIDSDGVDQVTVSGFGAAVNASSNYPIGDHIIYWSFEDGCGNVSTCTQEFSVLSCKAPVAYCINGISLALEPVDLDGDGIYDTEQATLSVDNVDAGSYHSCGTPIDLSFSSIVTNDVLTFDCNDIGNQTVELWVTDANGNTSFCTTSIQVQDNNTVDLCNDPKDCIIFPAENIEVSTCNANLDPQVLNSFPAVLADCFCQDFSFDFTDDTVVDGTNNCTSITRTWTVTFNCASNSQTCSYVQTIDLINQTAPIIVCPSSVVVSSAGAADCMASVVLGVPTVNTDCISGFTITNNSAFANANSGAASGDYPVGETTVIYTVSDICGNTSTCSTIVTVTDDTAPICNLQDISVTLVNDVATVVGLQFDNGSTDLCSTGSLSFVATPTTFSCDDIGNNIVTVVVTDENNNSCSSTATVTVIDNVAPVCNLNDITVQVTSTSDITVTGMMLNNNSSDSCGDAADITFDVSPSSFGCNDIGVNTVTVIATDLSGNTTTCTTTVTVTDNVAPICILQDITVSIDANEMVTINPIDLNNGSFDACGGAANLSFTATPTVFDCTDIGVNLVSVVVMDASGNSTSCTAMVTVEDVSTPICNVQDITVTLDATGEVNFTGADLDNGSSSGCSGSVQLSVVPSFFACNDIGENTVVVTVTDDNNNTSTCTAIVTVVDMLAPICILQDITVSLDATGIYTVVGSDLDNGSTDPCGFIVDFAASPASLDCTNAGVNLVTVTVSDNGGNSTTCQANVTILDVLAPICNVQDITVSIGVDGQVTVDGADVDNGSVSSCGSAVNLSLSQSVFDCNNLGVNVVNVTVTDSNNNTTTCTTSITVVDDNAPVLSCPANITLDCGSDVSDLSAFGTATINNSCTGFTINETVVSNINVCSVGTIVRTFTAFNATTSVQCSQVITINGAVNPLTLADITFPPAVVNISSCVDLSPENIPGGGVTVDQSNLDCANITIGFTDVDPDPNGSCTNDQIIRTYVITDSCQIVQGIPGSGIFTFVQEINVTDVDPPVISGPQLLNFACPGQLSLPVSVTDCRLASVTNDSPFADSNIGADASGFYPGGTTVVTVTAIDECGLTSTFSYTINVTPDTEAPMMECKKLTADMDDSGAVTFLPTDFVCLLNDNCTDSLDIDLFIEFFDANGNQILLSELVLTCDDLTQFLSLNFIAVDESGNIGECKSGITFLDPLGFCNTPNAIIEGIITTENDHFVDNVEVALEGSNMESVITDENGLFAFPIMEVGGTYMVMPKKDINPLEGVSTLDLVMIQRHLLGIQSLDSPYKHIAADINNSNTISGLDLIELRKLILGVTESLPNNTSWKMIDSNFDFDQSIDPLSQTYNDYLMLDPLTASVAADFIGVKIGDVNGSWLPAVHDGSAVNRDAIGVTLSLINDENAGLAIVSNEDIETYGLQMELDLHQIFDLRNINSSVFDLNEFNWNVIDEKVIISIHSDYLVKVKAGTKLFNFDFEYPIFDEMVSLSNERLNAELYDQNLVIRPLILDQSYAQSNTFEVFQNEPNPWSEYTTVNFSLPQAQMVKLNVYDLSGKTIYSNESQFESGKNSIVLSQSDLSAHGMFYFELTLANGETKAIKMIVLK